MIDGRCAVRSKAFVSLRTQVVRSAFTMPPMQSSSTRRSRGHRKSAACKVTATRQRPTGHGQASHLQDSDGWVSIFREIYPLLNDNTLRRKKNPHQFRRGVLRNVLLAK